MNTKTFLSVQLVLVYIIGCLVSGDVNPANWLIFIGYGRVFALILLISIVWIQYLYYRSKTFNR